MKKVSIYGLGNFGYALLKHLDQKQNPEFNLFGYDRKPDLIQHLHKKRQHLYLHKNICISKKVNLVNNVKSLVTDCNILILAVPSTAIREVASRIKKFINQPISIINTAKALDYKTGQRLSEIIKTILKNKKYFIAMLAGGTIAKDLFNREPLGANLACEDKKILKNLVELLQSNNLSIYPSIDLIGVEYAAAFKNVVSVLAGIIHGMGFSYGAETHIISRAACEIENMVIKELSGAKKTFAMNSQCWGNDLWMSCTGKTRNRELGILLGRGFSVNDAIGKMQKQNKTVEGIRTIKVLHKITSVKNYPLMAFLHDYFHHKTKLKSIKKIIFNHQF